MHSGQLVCPEASFPKKTLRMEGVCIQFTCTVTALMLEIGKQKQLEDL